MTKVKYFIKLKIVNLYYIYAKTFQMQIWLQEKETNKIMNVIYKISFCLYFYTSHTVQA